MLGISFFGKGGIGKSTITCNLSATFAKAGLSVIQIGCDPKRDSVARLVNGRHVPPILDHEPLRGMSQDQPDGVDPPFVVRGVWGTACVEAGGPEPGVGCGGRGVDLALQYLSRSGEFHRSFDITILDVLGDIVCGGFAAPVRRGFGQDVCIVTSEEVISLYAANNIARMVSNYESIGARLLGIVLNSKSVKPNHIIADVFARRIGTDVLGVIPFDRDLAAASEHFQTVVERTPQAPIVATFRDLGEAIRRASERPSIPPATPMDEEAFNLFVREELGGEISEPEVVEGRVDPAPSGPVAATFTDEDLDAQSRTQPWLTGGARSLRLLSELLRVPVRVDSARPATEIFRVQWSPLSGEIAVDLDGAGEERLRLLLCRPGGERYYFANERLALSYQVENVDAAKQKRVLGWLERVVSRLSNQTTAELVASLGTDPERRAAPELLDLMNDGPPVTDGASPQLVPGESTDADDDDDDEFGRLLVDWGMADAWRRFCCYRELRGWFEVDAMYRFMAADNITVIRHGDRECQDITIGPLLQFPLVGDPLRSGGSDLDSLDEPASNWDVIEEWCCTNLDERDIILGGSDKLDQLLNWAVETDRRLVRIESTCTTDTIGEDVENRFHATAIGLPCPAEYFDTITSDRKLVEHVRRVVMDVDGTVETIPDTYNLIGFAPSIALRSLVAVLTKMDLELNQMFLPGVFSGPVERFAVAQWNIVCPNVYYEPYVELLPDEVRERTVTFAAPFGFERTGQWLSDVASMFGRGERGRAVIANHRAMNGPPWRTLRHQAADRRVAITLGRSEVDSFLDPRYSGGIDLTEVITEAGFSLDIVVPDQPIVARVTTAAPSADVFAVAGEDEWRALAKARGWQSAFSNVLYETRLQSIGVGRFSIADFSVGYEGTINMATRILATCRSTFNKKYSKYLAT